jgi:hypothetical protein
MIRVYDRLYFIDLEDPTQHRKDMTTNTCAAGDLISGKLTIKPNNSRKIPSLLLLVSYNHIDIFY